MVRKATAEDTMKIALLLKKMAIELMPEYASDNDMTYFHTICEWIDDKDTHIYVDNLYRGFYVIVDDHEAIFPDYHRYINTKVYIEPQYRKTRLYSKFFRKVLEDFSDGDIIGVTEINSEHIPVLEKRHERIANVYKVNK